MMRQMGEYRCGEPIEVAAAQGRFIGVTMKNPQANTSFHAMMFLFPDRTFGFSDGPEQNSQQIGRFFSRYWGGCDSNDRGESCLNPAE